MLEGLKDIDWAGLHHAYGSASDVPQLIRDLASRRARTRNKALRSLYGNIFHQGTRWEASRYAVPFLYELLADPGTPDRERVIELLLHLAIGYEEAFLTEPFDASAARRAQASWPDNRFFVDTIDVYDAVVRGAGALVAAVRDPSQEVRLAAVHALAFLPEMAAEALPALLHEVQEGDDRGRANAVLAAGMLAESAGRRAAVSAIARDLLDGEHSWLTRFSASITALRLLPAGDPGFDRAFDVLVDAIGGERIDCQTLAWNDGDLRGLAAMVLQHELPRLDERSIRPMCEALRSAAGLQAVTMAEVLLHASFVRRGDVPESSDQLDDAQRAVLEALSAASAWQVAGATFANFSDAVRDVGLPDSRRAIASYLSGTPLSECLPPGRRR